MSSNSTAGESSVWWSISVTRPMSSSHVAPRTSRSSPRSRTRSIQSRRSRYSMRSNLTAACGLIRSRLLVAREWSNHYILGTARHPDHPTIGGALMAVETKARRPKNRISADLSGPPASKDDIRSLPATIEWLRREGLLLETDVEVNGDLELTGVQKHFDGSYPVLFNNVKGYPHARAITNLFANMEIVNRYFGWTDGPDRTRKLAHALTHPIPAEIVSQESAPVQEEVITDPKDVNELIMAIRHTVLESEITVGSGISVVIGDYFHGGSHIGYNRMNFRWGNIGTFQRKK